MEELRVGDVEGVDEEDEEGEVRLSSMRRCGFIVIGVPPVLFSRS